MFDRGGGEGGMKLNEVTYTPEFRVGSVKVIIKRMQAMCEQTKSVNFS